MKRNRLSSILIFSLILTGLFLLFLGQNLPVHSSPSATNIVHSAWQKAGDVGAYAYTTDIVQTTTPSLTLENVGLSPQEQRLYLEGEVNKSADQMQMKLWSAGGNPVLGQGAIEMKVENGRSYGRVNEGEWQQVDQITNFFAPGQDPLGYLNAAVDIAHLEQQAITLLGSNAPSQIDKYNYRLDGPRFAYFMRTEMEKQLAQQGKLPAGVQLETADTYARMTGNGELWLDQQGLPVRQIIHVTFPAENGEQSSATITTDFTGWQAASPAVSFLSQINLAQVDWQTAVINSALILLSLAFVALLVSTRHARKLHQSLVILLIATMLLGPLLQVRQISAFYEDLQTESNAQSIEPATASTQPAADNTTFDPHASLMLPQTAVAALTNDTSNEPALPAVDDGRDDDNDNLTNFAEIFLGTDPANPDSDGDGLRDGIEMWQTGTTPLADGGFDSDGDGLSDGAEVRGFSGSGQTWYLNPAAIDSNQDGLADGYECDVDINDNLICPDTDNDGTPDVYDSDNDGDGVPDALDISATTMVGNVNTGLNDETFLFDLTDTTANTPLFVDFQLRPTNPEHLWYSMNVLDWPSGDTEGQITRMFDTTFGATGTDANGDMRLIPMLEIEIDYQNEHYGNLPVKAGAPAITPTTPVADWLDTAVTDSFGISVRRKDNSGNLLAYVPLTLVQEEQHGSAVAFSGRMVYRPDSIDFGNAQEVRLFWMVEMLTDSCKPMPADFMPNPDMTESERVEAWCADSTNWQPNGSTIVHGYYDNFYLTGLAVREDLGMETAVIFQDPALADANPDNFNDDYLWTLARGLERTFLTGRTNGSSSRDLTISDISQRFDKTQNGASSDDERWQIPPDTFHIETYSFAHEGELATMPMTHTKELLNTYFTPQVNGGITDPTLLFLREERFRSLNLELSGNISVAPINGAINSNSLTLSLDPATVKENVYASMNWAPYQYDTLTSAWQAYDPAAYWADKGEDLHAALTATTAEPEFLEQNLFLSQTYYFTLRTGIGNLVEVDGQPANLAAQLADIDLDAYLNNSVALTTPGAGVQNLVGNFSAIFNDLGRTAVFQNLYNTGQVNAGDFKQLNLGGQYALRKNILQNLPVSVDSTGTQITLPNNVAVGTKNLAKIFGIGHSLAKGNAILSTLASISQIVTGFTDAAGTASVTYVFSAINLATNSVSLVSAVSTFRVLHQSLGLIDKLGVVSTLKSFMQATPLKGLLIGAIIAVAVTVGLFIYQLTQLDLQPGSLAFDLALQQAITTTVATILLVAIAAIPVVGQIVAAIFGIIDALIAIICTAVGADPNTLICGGIAGLLAKALQYMGFDSRTIINLEHENRLNLDNLTSSLTDPAQGFIVGNSLTVQMDVGTALYPNVSKLNRPFEESLLRQNSFVYDIVSDTVRIDETLSWDAHPGDWHPPLPTEWAPDSALVRQEHLVDTIPFTRSGINWRPTAYLAEGFSVVMQKCHPTLLPGSSFWQCSNEPYNDTVHIDLGSKMVFDIFPPTLTEFYTLRAAGADSYALNWGDFPALMDADGDGLRSRAFGGNDPNDSLPDTDGDGLSDFLEIQLGFDPAVADGDNDGLNDYEERRYNTDPYLADTDRDGLSDGEEAAGWEFIYDYNGSTPLTTWVWSDPLVANADGDAYLDSVEKAYGFNPNMPSNSEPLSMISQISAGDAVVQPGATISYTVGLTNNLSNRYLLGLLDVQFPAAVQNETLDPQSFLLHPDESQAMDGTITVANLTASQPFSLTNRAGVVAADLNAEVNGRTLWYHFNETSGTEFEDSTLNGRYAHCTTDCPAPGLTGYQGTALSFNGSQTLDVNANPGDVGLANNSFTLMAWVNMSSTFGTQSILNVGPADGVLYLEPVDGVLGMDNGRPAFRTNNVTFTAPYTILSDSWHHIAWRYNHATLEYTLFLNGQQLAASQPGFPFPSPINLSDGSIKISAQEEIASEDWLPFTGLLDEVELYPTALTNEQIANSVGSDSSLVFYYQFEDPVSNGDWKDNSVYQNRIQCEDKDLNKCPLDNQPGVVQQAYEFAQGAAIGEADALYVPFKPNLNLSRGSGSFTIAAWLKLTPGEDGGKVMGHHLAGADYPGFAIFPGNELFPGRLVAEFRNVDAPASCSLENDNLPELTGLGETKWHHVALTFDGVTFSAYLNNEFIGSVDCAGNRPPDWESFYIGHDASGPYSEFDGLLDELRIYNYALNTGEIDDLFWGAGPVLELRLDEAPAREIFADRTLNQINGTCAGATCPVSGVPGRINQSLLFDGVDDVVALDTADVLHLTSNSFTVSAWINGRNLESSLSSPLLGTPAFGGPDRVFMGFSNAQPAFVLGSSGLLMTPTALQSDRWYHLAFTYDYEPGVRHEQAILLDGTVVVSQTLPLSDPHALQGIQPVNLGHVDGGYFNGRIDQFMIHNQALTPAHIQQLIDQAPLINLHLDEGAGATTFINDANPAYNASCNSSSCPISNTKGRIYNGITFDRRQRDVITIPHQPGFQPDSISVGMWVKPALQPGYQQELGIKGTPINPTFRMLMLANSMNVTAVTKDSSCGTHQIVESNTPLIPNVWNHVMLTNGDNALTLYINGAKDAHIPVGDGLCAVTDDFTFGNLADNFYSFIGEMDEILVYPSALSAREVAEQVAYQASWFDTSYSHNILVDADDPIVNLDVTAPYLPLQEQILVIQARDLTSDIAQVEYQVNSGGWQTAARDLEVWLFNFQPAAEGMYTIDVRATDLAGNQTTSLGNSVVVDGTPPTVENVNVVGVTAVPVSRNHAGNSWDVTISGDIVSTGSPAAALYVTLLDETGAPVNGRYPATLSGNTFQLAYPFDLRPNGSYTVTLEAHDDVGNQGSQQLLALIDGTAPVASQITAKPDQIVLVSSTTITGTVVESSTIQSDVTQVEVGIIPLGESNLSGVHAMRDGLQLHLPLDEEPVDDSNQPTSLFADVSGLGNNAVCSGAACPAVGEPGAYAQALLFDGQDDLLTVPALPASLNSGALAFGAWVRLQTAVTNEQHILQFSNGQTLLYNQTQQRFIYRDGTAGDQLSSNTFAPDQWIHLLVAIDAENNGTLFVNGRSEATFTTTMRPQTGTQLRIGAQVQGWVDDVFVYGRPFTAQTARQHARGFAPVLHLALDEGIFTDGSGVHDLSRQQQTALFSGDTAFTSQGIVGAGALAFNGSNQAITVSGSESLDLSDGEFTQMAWVYRASGNAGISVINGVALWGQEAQAYPSLGVLNNQIGVSFGDGTTFDSYLTGDVLVENSWNFVAVAFDGDLYRIYVNGQLVDSTSLFAGKRPYAATTFAIARNPLNGGGYLFDAGMLDDIRIYRQALSTQAIADLYHQGWVPASLNTTVPAASWNYQIPGGLHGAYRIDLRTTDDNGNVSIGVEDNESWEGYISALGLNNVAVNSVLEGETAVLTGNFLDIIPGNTLTMTVDWGDGPAETHLYSTSAGSFNFSHLYADDDPTGTAVDTYPITLTVQFDNVFVGTQFLALQVRNQAPVVNAGGNLSGVVDTAVAFSGSFTDAGVRDTHTILWDFGDGATSSELTPTHIYTASGTYTASLTVTDDDGGSATDTIQVQIGAGQIFLPLILHNYASGPDLVVQNINVTANNVTVTIANVGDAPVEDAFWVDVYFNPNPPPTAVNQTWDMLGAQGLVWGIDTNALPLLPGESLILTIGDEYFRAAESNFSGTIAAGTAVYAQVDSANENHPLGAVQENHERNGTAYNNVLGPVVTATTFTARETAVSAPNLSPLLLPVRESSKMK